MDRTPDDPWLKEIREQQHFLHRLARNLVADEHGAEDLVQDAWAAALHGAPAEPISLRGWFRRVMRNNSINRAEQARRRERREQATARPERVSGPETMEARLELGRRVVEAVQALPEPNRRAIYLRYYEDLGPEAIALRLGVPAATVRSRLARGRELLRQKLDRDFGGERGAWSAIALSLGTGTGSFGPTATGTGMTERILETVLMTSKTTQLTVAAVAVALGALLWTVNTGEEPGEEAAPATASRVTLDAAETTPESRSIELLETGAPALARREALLRDTLESLPSTGLAALEIRLTHEADESPAAGIRGHLEREKNGPPHGDFVTDVKGLALLEDLDPGHWLVHLHGHGGAEVELEADRVTILEQQLPPGAIIEGLVLDPDERPVPGAEIFLSNRDDRPGEWVLARTGENGRFALRDLHPWTGTGPGTAIAARAPGFASSPQWDVHSGIGQMHEVVLRLSGPAGRLCGRVVDWAGTPVPGAVVTIGSSRGDYHVSAEGLDMSRTAVLRCRTDEAGAFDAPSVPPGNPGIVATAHGYTSAKAIVVVRREENAAIELILARPGSIHGTVDRGDGRPAGNVEVSVAYGLGYGLGPGTRTDENGNYELEGVDAGRIAVNARDETLGKASHSFQLYAGRRERVDLTLHSGAEARGRVIDEEGEPLAYWYVCATPHGDDGHWTRSTRTDLEGHFHLRGLPPEATSLELRLPSPFEAGPVLILENAFPAEEELEIVVDPAMRPSAFVSGRVVDEDGEPIEGAGVILNHEEHRFDKMAFPDPASHLFRLGPLVPGPYRITAKAPGFVPTIVPGVELDADEALDLGDVVLRRGGRLEFVLIDSGGRRLKDELQCRLQATNSPPLEGRPYVSFREGVGLTDPLPPGSYTMAVCNWELAATVVVAEVFAGRTEVVEVVVEPGTYRVFRLELPAGAGNEEIEIEILGPDGRPFPGSTFLFDVSPGEDPAIQTRNLAVHGLTLGTYELTARSESGRLGRATFTVESLEASLEEPGEVLVIELR